MKILVIGKTAREQAFIQKLANSNKIEKIYCVPGNPAIAKFAECTNIALDDLTSIAEFVKENKIDLTIALDEYIIQNGITNIFRQENLKIFSPTMEAAQIATSRAFAKKFFYKNKIPTARYGIFDKEQTALEYLKNAQMPVIIKYDYLTHQDSFICKSFIKAKNKVAEVFENVQKKVIIEDYLDGENITFSILTDGYNVLPLPYVKEYKNNLDGDGGEITKGVGAYCPSMKITSKLEDRIAKEIVFPILDAFQRMGTPYEGFLSLNLLLQSDGKIFLQECLPTISITEAVCTLPLIENDLFDAIFAATNGALEDCYQNFEVSDDSIVTAALMSGSYPVNPRLNSIVNGIENLDEDNIELYYNDVGMNSDYEIVTTGGRAFFITSRASTLNKAVNTLYENVDTIDFLGKHYRKDIGKTIIPNNY